MKTRSRVTYQTRTRTENHKYDEVQLIEQQPLTILEYLSASLVIVPDVDILNTLERPTDFAVIVSVVQSFVYYLCFAYCFVNLTFR
jgi:hypothetical protein